jgi:hypothetical protein
VGKCRVEKEGEKGRKKRRRGMGEGDERGIAAGRYLSRLASKTLIDKGTAGVSEIYR